MPDARIAIPNDAGWATYSLAELCSLISRGSAPVYVEHSPIRAIGQRCVTAAGFEPAWTRAHAPRAMDRVLIPSPGDVLLNSTGTGTIGRSCVFAASGRFIVDGHVSVLRPAPHRADGRWLNALLRTPWGQAFLETQCYSGSTNQVELSRTRLSSARTPTPPLPEQRQIATILDTIDDAIRKTEQIIAKLMQVKQGLLHDLLTRGIDDNGELRDPERHPEQFKDSPLGRIPKEWEVRPLRGFAEILDPNPSHRYPAPVEDGVPIASTENFLGDDEFDLSFSSHVPHRVFEQQTFRCNYQPTDVVFARKGRIGFARPYGKTRKVFSHTVVLMKPREGAVPRFLLWLLRNDQFFEGIRGRMNTNLGVPTLGVGFLGGVRVPVPSEAEQVHVAEVIDAASEQLAGELAALSKFRVLKAGLMEDLLTGRVRVTALLETAAE